MIGDARAAIRNIFWLPGTPILTRSSFARSLAVLSRWRKMSSKAMAGKRICYRLLK